MSLIEVKVPDIGDYHDVPVIEVLVKPGDVLAPEDPICTLESDKATMDVPCPVAGVVREVLVKVGDKVAEGTPIIHLEAAEAGKGAEASSAPSESAAATPPAQSGSAPALTATPSAPRSDAAAAVAPSAPAYTGEVHHRCQLLVLGGGPGGYSAAFRAADLGLDVLLVEREAVLGGVCLNVGCIPSKALLHLAAGIGARDHLAQAGIVFEAPKIDLDRVRAHRDEVVGRLTKGLAGMAKARGVRVLQGEGRLVGPHHLEVRRLEGDPARETGVLETIEFEQAILAAGSWPVRLPFQPDDPRVVDSTGALALPLLPQRMLVIGGGIIGLEMGTVYAAFGATVDVVEATADLFPGADRDLVRVWEKKNAGRFGALYRNTRTTALEARADGIWASFEGESAPKEAQRYDLVLVAVGRRPNGPLLGLEAAGVRVDERGFIPVDPQRRTNVPHVFAIGDLTGNPMLAHKAVHEGHVAAEAAAGRKVAFDALQIPSVAYTDPEIAWAGLTEAEAKARGLKVEKAVFPWAASGRAIANGCEEGFTKLLFDAETHRLVGGAIVGAGAGDLIGEICLAIEMGAEAGDIARTIHPHPTLIETVGLAAEVAEGSCTDLPPARKR
jgi:dihydrolipoamide dehydrogenase